MDAAAVLRRARQLLADTADIEAPERRDTYVSDDDGLIHKTTFRPLPSREPEPKPEFALPSRITMSTVDSGAWNCWLTAGVLAMFSEGAVLNTALAEVIATLRAETRANAEEAAEEIGGQIDEHAEMLREMSGQITALRIEVAELRGFAAGSATKSATPTAQSGEIVDGASPYSARADSASVVSPFAQPHEVGLLKRRGRHAA